MEHILYYQTPAGVIEAVSTPNGISKAQFVDCPPNIKFADENDIKKFAFIGTSFQQQVWNELLKIPLNSTLSYQELAEKIGAPTAWRAVANAVGKNPIAYLVPCHRVVRKNGELGGYRWGVERKKKLLESEKP